MYQMFPLTQEQAHALEHDFFGKKARARREARKAKRRSHKMDKINARQGAKTERVQLGGGFANAIKNVGGALSGILGTSQAPAVPDDFNPLQKGISFSSTSEAEILAQQEAEQAAARRKMVTTIVVVLVIAVVVLVVVKMRKNKKKSA